MASSEFDEADAKEARDLAVKEAKAPVPKPKDPGKHGFTVPPEWAPHRAVWLAWPSHEELWEDALPQAQQEFIGLCEAIADVGPTGRPRGETLSILIRKDTDEHNARLALEQFAPRFHRAEYGDIWLRDTGPVFLTNQKQDMAALAFVFNGWGEKYDLFGDKTLSRDIGKRSGAKVYESSLVTEGGALEFDGDGTLLTTRSCILDPFRNPDLEQGEAEAALMAALGVTKVLWLDKGLLNDHTDGHIDTLVRFIEPGRVLAMEPSAGDPNHQVLTRILERLSEMTDAKGRRLTIEKIPSPGEVLSSKGDIMPASYANYYIANTTVVVPTYGVANDDAAVAAIAKLFPSRKVVGKASKTILEGGGAFHCITQHQPM